VLDDLILRKQALFLEDKRMIMKADVVESAQGSQIVVGSMPFDGSFGAPETA